MAGYFSAIAQVLIAIGIDILQQDRIGTDGEHVFADLPEMRDGPQSTHDAADAKRIGDRLAQTEFLGQLEIGDGGRLVAADLEGDDDKIGAVERAALVGRCLDRGRDAKRVDELVGDDRGLCRAAAR